jgi:hypothetical protein
MGTTKKKSATAEKADAIRQEAAALGFTVSAKLRYGYNSEKVESATITVEATFPAGDVAAYRAAEANANDLLRHFRMTQPGSVWGTDSASVGGHAGLTGGYMRLSKSGVEIRLARQFA